MILKRIFLYLADYLKIFNYLYFSASPPENSINDPWSLIIMEGKLYIKDGRSFQV